MSTKKYYESNNNSQGWDSAIEEAEKQLKKWRSKVVRLMASLETFREAKKEGIPWPGEQPEGESK